VYKKDFLDYHGSNLPVSCGPADLGLVACLPFTQNRTGASGYIGGDVLHLLKTSHPEYDVSILLRDSVKADAIKKVFPDVRVVLGDLDSASLIEEEASRADVIISKFPF